MSTSPWKGRRSESNNGWEGYGPWPYTILEEPDLSAQIERLAQVQTHDKTELLSFQPWPEPGKNQDRSLITTWTTSQGTWKVFCIFDGTLSMLNFHRFVELIMHPYFFHVSFIDT